ncbi:MAG: hypothetical protein F6K42_30545, partial [Leptolyngbya sp. SIO1D8]|nr:hypothetical protein [Leptolyngbya sp. SIO1D8]
QGALMDIELQRELLIHRFGVSPRDVFTLVDAEATTQKILEAIQVHLADQVRPGDTVLFHFSGLGSQVHLTGQLNTGYLPTLVTADSQLPSAEDPAIQDLFEETLSQALSSLQGVRVITILDASSAEPRMSPFQGNFRVRSRLSAVNGEWQTTTNARFKKPDKAADTLSANWPGLLLRASKPGLPALEGDWHGFSAGVFTYALTQQIWRSSPAQRQQWVFRHTQRLMETWTGAKVSPQLQGQGATKGKSDLLISGVIPQLAADGIVKTVDSVNKNALLWLGGLPVHLLPYCNLGLRLRPLPSLPGLAAVPTGTVLIKAIENLKAKAEFLDTDSLPTGTPLVEVERRLPREIALTVALDPALERIERVDATSALAALPDITTTASGEQQADCLFGRLNALNPLLGTSNAIGQKLEGVILAKTEPVVAYNGYGLFSPDRTLLPGTATEEDEAVKTAVGRLSLPLHTLLAVKVLRLTENAVSSQLPLRLTLETLEPASTLLTFEETLRSHQFSEFSSTHREKRILNTRGGGSNQKFRIQLLNLGEQPLYYLLVSVMEQSRFSIYCPIPAENTGSPEATTTDLLAEASRLPPGDILKFPKLAGNSLSLQQLQSAEIFAIACTKPFYETWKTIRMSEFQQLSDRFASMPDPLPVTKAVLRDLHYASESDPSTTLTSQESMFVLRSHAWATLFLRSPITLT